MCLITSLATMFWHHLMWYKVYQMISWTRKVWLRPLLCLYSYLHTILHITYYQIPGTCTMCTWHILHLRYTTKYAYIWVLHISLMKYVIRCTNVCLSRLRRDLHISVISHHVIIHHASVIRYSMCKNLIVEWRRRFRCASRPHGTDNTEFLMRCTWNKAHD